MIESQTVRARADDERAFIELALTTVGVDAAQARDVADVLLAADLRGIESHGIARLRWFYVDRIRLGTIKSKPSYRVVRETPASFLLDADNGLGHPASIVAMKKAIALADQHGIAFAAVRNSNHYGIAGYYAMMALEHDMIGMRHRLGALRRLDVRTREDARHQSVAYASGRRRNAVHSRFRDLDGDLRKNSKCPNAKGSNSSRAGRSAPMDVLPTIRAEARSRRALTAGRVRHRKRRSQRVRSGRLERDLVRRAVRRDVWDGVEHARRPGAGRRHHGALVRCDARRRHARPRRVQARHGSRTA